MPRMTVGGRTLDLDQEQVLRKMRGVEPEMIREHLVEVGETVFPPKQVLAVVTGWDRQTFTTMEANRVLARVGLTCRRPGGSAGGRAAWVPVPPDREPPTLEERVTGLEEALIVAQQAIVGLTARIGTLEARD